MSVRLFASAQFRPGVVAGLTRAARALAPAALALAASSVVTAQSAPAPAAGQTAAIPDPEAGQDPPAAVMVGGDPVLMIAAGAGPYTSAFRAERITQRVADVIKDRTLVDGTVSVAEVDGASELRAGGHLLMVVTQRDAASIGTPRAGLAQQYARILEEAIRAERLRYHPSTLIRSAIFGAFATVVFGGLVWFIFRTTRALGRVIGARAAMRVRALRAVQDDPVAAARLHRAVGRATFGLRVFFLVATFELYLTYVLGLFPWTRAISRQLLEYAFTPIRAVALAVAGYLPKLLFVVVIILVVNAAIRLIGLFFRLIQQGRLVFANFPAEWADPTNKIARLLLVAFGLVVAFPYLPASDSPAFAGVSVFMGILFSLASSSALSNMIAGVVLTYTGAFRLGDRVKLGDAFGDIIEMSLLATRVRTIKNEDITIPNSIALGSAVTNYTREAKPLGLILHTTVTIGYDAPWRTIHDLLIEAARATPGVLAEPRPFVWQTSLNDFYVTYEINAYTASPRDMIDIYAALHANIQDTFYQAGVEIMSPHFTAVRDGNTVAIPEALRPRGYEAPALRVQNTMSATEGGSYGNSDRAEVPRPRRRE